MSKGMDKLLALALSELCNEEKRDQFHYLGNGKRNYTHKQKNYALSLIDTHGVRATSRILQIPRRTIQRWCRKYGLLVAFSRTTGSYSSVDDDIYLVDPLVGEPSATIIYDVGDDQDPRWSPDGAKIAFSAGSLTTNFEIFVMDADGSNPSQVTTFPHGNNQGSPDWNTDGTKIVFTSSPWSVGNNSIWILDLDTDALEKIYEVDGQIQLARWSPDGCVPQLVSKLQRH